MSELHPNGERPAPPFFARTIRRFSMPIILAWLAIIAVLTIGVPSLEQVEKEHSVSLTPEDAPSVKAMKRMGDDFKESASDSVALIALEGEQPLGEDAHKYYDRLVAKLKSDPKHVQHIQDFWSDPLTAGGAQSADGKAAYVQLNLAGNVGQALANESAEAVRMIVERTPPPPRVKAYVTGPAALTADMYRSGDRTVATITAVAVATIFIMLLLVYRSITTVILLLLMVGMELLVARGLVAFLGYPVPRGTSGRRGSGDGLLHHLPRGRTHCLGIRFDNRRSGFLPQLHTATSIPTLGCALRGGHAGRHRGGAHAGSGCHCGGQPLRAVRPPSRAHRA
jgi:putative drug exporter of the RND superfamily